MNYFGHAVISRRFHGVVGEPPGAVSEHAGTAGYALGAMLPDFASMCGGRIEGSSDPQIAAGIELHHRTDAVFHHLPPVLALMRELEERLRTAGCRRGPTRAVSHLGVELLLDGVFVDEATDRQLYLDAVTRAGQAAETLRWREAEHAGRFATLLARLDHHGVPDDLRHSSSVTERLLRILGRRPLLAPQGADASIIETELASYHPRVTVAAATVLRGVLAALAS
jgi:acyl carrier protein phosphodiesterase